MLNLHCNNSGKKKIICHYRDSNPGYMGSKSTEVSSTLWRPMEFIDKNNICSRVGKMCNPHPRKSNALGKHM